MSTEACKLITGTTTQVSCVDCELKMEV
jgi:hypothetical protein